MGGTNPVEQDCRVSPEKRNGPGASHLCVGGRGSGSVLLS